MAAAICRICGRLFEEKTGEVTGEMIFNEQERGKLLCKECLRTMHPEKAERDL